MDTGGPTLSPHACARSEHTWSVPLKGALLLWRELYHPMLIVGIAQRSKDFAADAKIGMVHVRGFHSALYRERNAAKLICGHSPLMRANCQYEAKFCLGSVWRQQLSFEILCLAV